VRSRERPPEVVRLSIDEITEMTVSALERGDLDRAAQWLGLILARNDPDDSLGASPRDDDETGS
jgi:hypothetical protein